MVKNAELNARQNSHEADTNTRFQRMQNTTNSIFAELRHLYTAQVTSLFQNLQIASS